MKKILPLLVVSFLVLSGFGAFTVPCMQDKTSQMALIKIDLTAGFGYKLTITNIGPGNYGSNIEWELTTKAPIMFKGQEWIMNSSFIELEPGQSKTFKSGLVSGFGLAEIHFYIDTKDLTVDADTLGFLLFVVILTPPIHYP